MAEQIENSQSRNESNPILDPGRIRMMKASVGSDEDGSMVYATGPRDR